MRRVLDRLDRQGRAASYSNKFIQRAKAFVHWLQRENRIVGDPLIGVRRVDEHNGRRARSRRALDDNEVLALLDTAPASRRLKYAMPLLAGIRRSEFRKLLWGDLKLNAPRPFIKLRPELTKNKKADHLPLHPYLVQLLTELPPGQADQPVLQSVPDMKTVAKDLLAAGIAVVASAAGPGTVAVAKGRRINIADRQGRRADFHALRHTYSTNLDRTGCSWVTKKALLRHSFSGVTEGYSHARLEELYAAIERLPSPLLKTEPTSAEQARKTGTDDVSAAARAPLAHQNAGGRRRGLSGNDAGGRGDAWAFEGSERQRLAVAPGASGGHWRASAGTDLNPAPGAAIVRETGPSTQVD
jgi:integrase